MDGLNYEEYFKKVDEMVGSLKNHWLSDQRVKALKVAIQLSKLLADTGQLKLYTKKYRRITESLDEFGQLVHNRIHDLASTNKRTDCKGSHSHESNGSGMNERFKTEAIELAKETCRNWFLKVASIRELVPRFYTELAILESCDILLQSHSDIVGSIQEQFFLQSLKRLSKAAWGFGNPIVALHARAYLCKVAVRLLGWQGDDRDANLFDLILSNLHSSVILVHNLDVNSILSMLSAQNIEISAYLELMSNPILSILSLIAVHYDDYDDEMRSLTKDAKREMDTLLEKVLEAINKDDCNTLTRIVILNAAFKALPTDILGAKAENMLDTLQMTHKNWKDSVGVNLISNANNNTDHYATLDAGLNFQLIPLLHNLLSSYMTTLDGSELFEHNSDDYLKGFILNKIDLMMEELHEYQQWTYNNHRLKQSSLPASGSLNAYYAQCFKAVLSYANHYGTQSPSVNGLLNRFVIIIEKDGQYTSHYPILLEILKSLITNETKLTDFERLFASKPFGQLFNLLRKDEHRLEASRWILETMRANIKLNYRGQTVQLAHSHTINFMMKLFATINDSVSLLTASDDFEHLSRLTIFFIQLVHIEDFSEQLEFFSHCRSLVGNLNLVLEFLISRVLQLPKQHRDIEKKRSIKQNFLNGCLAYVYITIPAIQNPSSRFDLSLDGCQLALANMSLSLADYYIKYILTDLQEQTLLVDKDRVCSSTHEEYESSIKFDDADRSRMDQKIDNLLNIILKYQDHIDLRHKLFISGLIKQSFAGNESLIQTLTLLNCRIDDDDDAIDVNNDNVDSGCIDKVQANNKVNENVPQLKTYIHLATNQYKNDAAPSSGYRLEESADS